MFLLGYDLGSSSIKAALVDAATGKVIKVTHSPKLELDIISLNEGWAEQEPELWWKHVCLATKQLLSESGIKPTQIASIGLAYQMHGLIIIDKHKKVLRPAIIWCDSRAVKLGNQAFEEIGRDHCLSHCLNSPGNFTAAKLKWVKDNESDIFEKIDKFLLPGDYLGMKLTGEICTTISGLSEAVLWDFKNHKVASTILKHFDIPESFIPDLKGSFETQGQLTIEAAATLGLVAGIPITYRAGDQPNNAMALGVYNSNELAATGGTSGVVYGILDTLNYDPESRINGFAHVNHSKDNPRIGQLLCINGAGIQYAWMKNQIAEEGISYETMEEMISTIPVGSDSLRVIPFGNGAERMINNTSTGAQVNNLQFNRHTKVHLFRAALEGIAFSFVYGIGLLQELGLTTQRIKVGNDNLFKSKVFSDTITNLLGCRIEVVDTNGAVGAARASGIAVGIYNNLEEAFQSNKIIQVHEPQKSVGEYKMAYQVWQKDLDALITKEKRGHT